MSAPVQLGKQLEKQQIQGSGGSVVKLTGVIDDTFDRVRLLEEVSSVIVFDLDGVTRITSYGVREWMAALRALPKETYYCFVRCRPAIVSQFNMVSRFGGSGQVISLHAPFLCPSCDHYFEVLIDLRQQHGEISAFRVQAAACPKCGAEAEFDDLPESYFAYVVSAPRPAPPPAAVALIEGERVAAPVGFRIEKEVDDDLTLLWLSGDLDRGAHFKRLADGLEGKILLLMSRITSINESGLRGLSSFLQVPGLDLFLMRLPLPLAKTLATTPGGPGGARVLSFILPFGCARHGRFEHEVRATALRSIPLSGKIPGCPQCQEPGKLLATPEDVDELRQLPLETPTPQVVAALHGRAKGPLAPPPENGNDAATPRKDDEANAFGRYQLVRRIGFGGMAEVFLARQRGPMGFEKRVVLKRILPQHSSQPEFVEMFLEEARLAARISHPNVVQIFDLGCVNDQFYIAMEYVQGWDLALLLRASRELKQSLSPGVACRIAMAISAGLHAAHTTTDEEGKRVEIVHRDVSPHNVLVASDGTVKVTDFGIAKVASKGSKTDPNIVKGKIAYLAPELFVTEKTVDTRADIWACGVILYYCLVQALPFSHATDAGTMRAILQDPAPSVLAARPDLPAELDAIVARALNKNSEARYSTAKAMEQDLEQVLAKLSAREPVPSIQEWIVQLTERAKMHPERLAAPLATLIGTSPAELLSPPTQLSNAALGTAPLRRGNGDDTEVG